MLYVRLAALLGYSLSPPLDNPKYIDYKYLLTHLINIVYRESFERNLFENNGLSIEMTTLLASEYILNGAINVSERIMMNLTRKSVYTLPSIIHLCESLDNDCHKTLCWAKNAHITCWNELTSNVTEWESCTEKSTARLTCEIFLSRKFFRLLYQNIKQNPFSYFGY